MTLPSSGISLILRQYCIYRICKLEHFNNDDISYIILHLIIFKVYKL